MAPKRKRHVIDAKKRAKDKKMSAESQPGTSEWKDAIRTILTPLLWFVPWDLLNIMTQYLFIAQHGNLHCLPHAFLNAANSMCVKKKTVVVCSA
jgi:hypothetical protein